MNMKKIKIQSLAVLVLSGIACMAFTYQAAPVDFKGKWMLDITKSDFGNTPVPKPSKSFMRIIQQDPMIVIEKSKMDSLGKTTVRMDTVVFDGKVRKITKPNGSVINRSSTRQWSADQKVMNIISKFSIDNDGQAVEFSGTEAWSVADGGKTLIMMMESVLPDRTEKAKLVYNRVD
jgi:hypothetical protein